MIVHVGHEHDILFMMQAYYSNIITMSGMQEFRVILKLFLCIIIFEANNSFISVLQVSLGDKMIPAEGEHQHKLISTPGGCRQGSVYWMLG